MGMNRVLRKVFSLSGVVVLLSGIGISEAFIEQAKDAKSVGFSAGAFSYVLKNPTEPKVVQCVDHFYKEYNLAEDDRSAKAWGVVKKELDSIVGSYQEITFQTSDFDEGSVIVRTENGLGEPSREVYQRYESGNIYYLENSPKGKTASLEILRSDSPASEYPGLSAIKKTITGIKILRSAAFGVDRKCWAEFEFKTLVPKTPAK